MGLFTVGTILAGSAPVFSFLLLGRMIQATGAAIVSPLLMNVMLVSFSVEKRGTAMGVMGMVMMGAPAIGPLLSGFILHYFDWRLLFNIIAPIALMILLAAAFIIKDKKEKVNIQLDVFSVLFSSIGFGGVLYGFSSAGDAGWNHPIVYGPISVGIIALVIFTLRQLKQEKPMLNFKIFQFPMYSLSIVISMIVSMMLFSSMILVPIYFITLRGIPPMEAGLMMLPGALILSIMSPIVGRLFDKYGGRVLALTGLFIITITSYFFSQLTFETTYFHLIMFVRLAYQWL
jgi:EmrB/QacA subfamily drug resistance transporter